MQWRVPQDTREFLLRIAEYHQQQAKELNEMAAAANADENLQQKFRCEAGWHTAAAIVVKELAKNMCPVLLRALIYKS